MAAIACSARIGSASAKVSTSSSPPMRSRSAGISSGAAIRIVRGCGHRLISLHLVSQSRRWLTRPSRRWPRSRGRAAAASQKRYGDVVAVDGLDLEVRRGECFGLLGPNGAGKTTTIEILEGLLEPDAGEVEVLGLRWGRHDAALRQRLGIQLQETQLSEKLTVEETIRLFRSFYRRGPAVDEVVADGGARGEAREPGGQALGRPEAAAGGGLRAGQRPRAALPRRAHDRPRPAVAPAALALLERSARAASCSPPTTWTRRALCDRVARGPGRSSPGSPRELVAAEAEHVVEFAVRDRPTRRHPGWASGGAPRSAPRSGSRHLADPALLAELHARTGAAEFARTGHARGRLRGADRQALAR